MGKLGKVEIALIAVIGFGVYKVGNRLFEFWNVVDTKEEKTADKITSKLSTMDFWKPSYQNEAIAEARKKKNKAILVISDNSGRKLAKDIYDAKGYVWDNSSTVVGAIRAMTSRASISKLSYHFYELYREDLYSYLQSGRDNVIFSAFVSDTDWVLINNYIKQLPEYKIDPNS